MVGAATCKNDALLLAIVPQRVVHECGIVVRIQSHQRKREPWSQAVYGFNDEYLFANRKSHALGPSRRYVRQDQRMHKAAYESGPAMHDQIDLQVAWSNFSPIPERANRNQLADAVNPRGLLLAAARRLFPHGPEQAIDRGGAHRKQLLLHTVVQLQMSMRGVEMWRGGL